MIRLAAWLIVSLVPGAFAWWSGRRLVQRIDDPALGERALVRQTRLGQCVGLTVAAAILVRPPQFALGIGLMFLGLGVGLYPARKVLLREEWSLGAYLRFGLRFWTAWLGVWLLLGLTPGFVSGASSAKWLIVVGLALVLLVWNARYSQIFLFLTRAQRLTIPPRLAGIIADASIPPPGFFRFGEPGGRVPYAFALPSSRAASVVFGDALFDALAPEEQAAVFAHEVAHLEYYDRRRLAQAGLFMWGLIAVNTIGIAVAPERLQRWAGLIGIGSMALFAIVLSRRKVQEEASDRRAVALCGDAEALVRALTKLHGLAVLPRRWDAEYERTATHPSLARRIQTIRRAAGSEPGTIPSPTIVESRAAGTCVWLGSDRFVLYTGVPPRTPHQADRLREHAGGCEEVQYSDLTDLQVKAGIVGGTALVATGRTGRVWKVLLRSEDVTAVQAALDAVDLRLASVPAETESRILLGRVVSILLVAVGLQTGQFPGFLGAGVAGIIQPGRASMAAVAASAFGAVGVAVRGGVFTWVGYAVLAGLCLAGALGLRLARRCPEERESALRHFALPLGIMMGFMLLSWGVVLVAYGGDIVLADAVDGLKTTVLALFGLGAGLVAVRERLARGAGVLIILVSLALIATGRP